MMIDRVREEYGAELDYTLLADPGHRVIDRYGLFNEESPESRPVPHPTTLVIDREGVIRWRYTEIDYRTRPTNEAIAEELRALSRTQTEGYSGVDGSG